MGLFLAKLCSYNNVRLYQLFESFVSFYIRTMLHFGFSVLGNHVVMNFYVGLLLALVYLVFYACLDAKAGSLAAQLCVIRWAASCFTPVWKVISGVLSSVGGSFEGC